MTEGIVPNAVFFCLHIDGGSLGKSSDLCDCPLVPQVGLWAIPPAVDPMEQKASPVLLFLLSLGLVSHQFSFLWPPEQHLSSPSASSLVFKTKPWAEGQAGEMTPLVKCLVCKCEDPSSIPAE